MASLGQRYVTDLMAEIGIRLLEPFVNTELTASVSPGSSVTIPVLTTDALYPGAFVVLGWHGASAEVVTVLTVPSATSFTADITAAHASGEIVFGGTFPTQRPTDPIFTQSEILGYIAQAQNEFLTRVPLLLQNQQQFLALGQTYQTLPATAIELERVAVQSLPTASQFTISTISRTANVVTATTTASTSADAWTSGLPIFVQSVLDESFNSSYSSTANSPFVLDTVSADGRTLTWLQSAADATSTGGTITRPVWTRLYESSQESLSLNQPGWPSQTQQGQPPRMWAEDRAGVYGWLVMPPPAGSYWLELLTSYRASETLGLLDNLLVPDIFAPYILYKVLEYCFSKDGVRRSPAIARYCRGRFEFGVLLADRFLRNVIVKTGATGRAAGGMF